MTAEGKTDISADNPQLSDQDLANLDDLRWHWGSAYLISFDGRTWSASPLADMTVVLTADNDTELRDQIRVDYRTHDQRGHEPPHQGCSL